MRINVMTTITEADATREALPFDAHLPACLTDAQERPVYLTVTNTEQLGHKHHFTQHNRWGNGYCLECGVMGWSAGWVRDGWQGRLTADWILRQIAWHEEQVGLDVDEVALHTVTTILGAEPMTQVAALLNEDMPAKPGRRAGLPVPQMQRGVLTVQS